MLIKQYEERGLLYNTNLCEPCSGGKLTAYRGELIVAAGEVLDSSGKRKPPAKLLQQASALSNETTFCFISGMLEDVTDLPAFIGNYGADINADSLCMIFVFNISKPAAVSHNGGVVHLIPLVDGLPWSELMQLAGLEKGDIKALSSADKVLKLFNELKGFKSAGATAVTLEQVASLANGKQRDIRGAV